MTVTVGVINLIALVAFGVALCWRLDQIRRQGWGLQPVAMSVAVASLTLAFVVADGSVSDALDAALFGGAARVVFYALLALGVAALIVVFFFPAGDITRERRAGWEALPLAAALVGLQVTMLVVPADIRTEAMTEWTLGNWGFALFFLIASGYLAYGFVACVRSVRRFLRVADGYLRVSLGLLMTGLVLMAVGAVAQIVFVALSAIGLVHLQWLLTLSRVFTVAGVVGFLLGISYPMLYASAQSLLARRRRRRLADELQPLWELVTTAVPEVVLEPSGSGESSPTIRLHRRVVEIRDALTQISPLLPPAFGYAEPDVQLRMLRVAIDEYREQGRPSGAVREVLPSAGGGLDDDAAPLLALARAGSGG